jgi:ABC-type nitrate/sulfonate/bicarbonate transport system substrate-binding protein
MVEPYATMFEQLGVGTVVRRTGDLWKDAPGCSLCTTKQFRDREPDVVQRVVAAFARAVRFVHEHRDESARIAARHIGISQAFIRKALDRNLPQVDAIRSTEAMQQILRLMVKLGYLRDVPRDFADLSFLDRVTAD